MNYYIFNENKIELTLEGQRVLSYFELTLNDLRNITKQQLINHCNKFKILNEFSRYFDMDAWFRKNINLEELPKDVQQTFPFMIVPKPSQREKNEGLDDLDYAEPAFYEFRPTAKNTDNWANDPLETPFAGTNRGGGSKNTHISVKPIKLFSYLVTLGSRKGDVVLDPFIGSGTTAIACVLTDRKYIGMEMDKEYYEIAVKRLKYHKKKKGKADLKSLQQSRI